MSSEVNSYSPSHSLNHQLLGEILLEADLISPSQLEMALADQHQFFMLKLGEIIALRGWLKQETIDFLVQEIINGNNNHLTSTHQYIGQYFQQAGLLTEEQIESILQEQKKLGIKFGYLAILKGFLKEKTVTFFLEKFFKNTQPNFLNKITTDSAIKEKKETLPFPPSMNAEDKDTLPFPPSMDAEDKDTLSSASSIETEEKEIITLSSDYWQDKTFTFNYALATEIKEETVITPYETITVTHQQIQPVYCGEIAYSSIWIDS